MQEGEGKRQYPRVMGSMLVNGKRGSHRIIES